MFRGRVREARVALPLSKTLRLLLQALPPGGESEAFLLELGIRVADTLRGSLDLGLPLLESSFPRGRVSGAPLELVVERLCMRGSLSQRGLHAFELGHRLRPDTIALATQMPLDVP